MAKFTLTHEIDRNIAFSTEYENGLLTVHVYSPGAGGRATLQLTPQAADGLAQTILTALARQGGSER